MERWQGKVAVVTGASAGIGASIAAELVKLGLLVVGFARRQELMESLALALKDQPGKLYALQTDITKENQILESLNWVKENLGPVSILVNNAGIVIPKPFIEGNVVEWRQTLDTYVMGLCIANREVIKDMRAHGLDGHIIHINGISGQYNIQLTNIDIVRCAKRAVTALTETLRLELAAIGSKIRVSDISPGVVDTGMVRTVKLVDEELTIPALDPVDVAEAVIYVLSALPHVQVDKIIIRPIGELL